ncbi:hypothetical protein T439DRAFT_322399 [Meredithblackwellia eburnea MCA 4105]
MTRPATPRTVESVTTACWSRNVDPSTWESLVRQVGASNSLNGLQLESQACSSLLNLLSSTSPPPPLLNTYLHHSIGLKDSPSSSKTLIRPGFLVRQTLNLSLPRSNVVDLVLHAVNGAIDSPHASSRLTAILQGGSKPTPSSNKDLVRLIGQATSAFTSSAVSPLPTSPPPTAKYLQLLLSRPPIPISSAGIEQNDEEVLLKSVDRAVALLNKLGSKAVWVDDLRTRLLSLQRAFSDQNGLQSEEGDIVMEDHHSDLTHLIGSGSASAGSTPGSHSLHSSGKMLEISAVINEQLNNPTSPTTGISNTSTAIGRLASAFRTSVKDTLSRGGTPEAAREHAWLEVLLSSTEKVRRGRGKPAVDTGLDEGELVIAEAFAYARLPEVIRSMLANRGLVEGATPESLQMSLEAAFRNFKATLSVSPGGETTDFHEKPLSAVLNSLVTGYCREELISVDVGVSLGDNLHPEDLIPQLPQDFYSQFVTEGDPDQLRSVLEAVTAVSTQSSLAQGVQMAIESWTRDHDLSTLASMCSALGTLPYTLDVMFLFIEPRAILKPVCEFLEAFDAAVENFGEGHPIERFGAIVLFLQIAVSRFALHRDLPHHLGGGNGFFCRWIPSISVVYALSDLDEEAKSVVDGWVADLFGEGISDDLMQSTKPQVLLRVAPTICKQFLAATQAGVIDIDSLRDASGYFHQDLLSFTLPGVIRWLVGEIRRTVSSSPTLVAMYELVKVFVLSEPLPEMVQELVSTDLMALVSIVTASSSAVPGGAAAATAPPPPPFDLAKLDKIVDPFRPVKV